jgi:hypothetical protein
MRRAETGGRAEERKQKRFRLQGEKSSMRHRFGRSKFFEEKKTRPSFFLSSSFSSSSSSLSLFLLLAQRGSHDCCGKMKQLLALQREMCIAKQNDKNLVILSLVLEVSEGEARGTLTPLLSLRPLPSLHLPRPLREPGHKL